MLFVTNNTGADRGEGLRGLQPPLWNVSELVWFLVSIAFSSHSIACCFKTCNPLFEKILDPPVRWDFVAPINLDADWSQYNIPGILSLCMVLLFSLQVLFPGPFSFSLKKEPWKCGWEISWRSLMNVITPWVQNSSPPNLDLTMFSTTLIAALIIDCWDFCRFTPQKHCLRMCDKFVEGLFISTVEPLLETALVRDPLPEMIITLVKHNIRYNLAYCHFLIVATFLSWRSVWCSLVLGKPLVASTVFTLTFPYTSRGDHNT